METAGPECAAPLSGPSIRAWSHCPRCCSLGAALLMEGGELLGPQNTRVRHNTGTQVSWELDAEGMQQSQANQMHV